MRKKIGWTLVVILAGVAAGAVAGEVNLIVNPDFGHVYAAQRQVAPDATYGRAEHRMLPKFEDKPVLPCGWRVLLSKNEAATISWVDDAGSKALRVRVPKGETARLAQCYVEVVPDGVYNFGLRVKGSGRIGLNVWAAEPGPDETLVSTAIDAGAEWKQIHVQKKVDPHRHLARFVIVLSGPADVTIRQAELSMLTY